MEFSGSGSSSSASANIFALGIRQRRSDLIGQYAEDGDVVAAGRVAVESAGRLGRHVHCHGIPEHESLVCCGGQDLSMPIACMQQYMSSFRKKKQYMSRIDKVGK